MKITLFYVSGDKVKIDIDGEFWQEIPYEIAFDFRLEKNMEISLEKMREIEQKVQEKTAFSYCLWYLSKYSTTTKKMKSKLYEKGYQYNVVEKTIEKLTEYNYLNDYAFAENFVRKKQDKYGKARLKKELFAKGVQSDAVEKALQVLEKDDIWESALAVAKKWYRSHELQTREDYQKFIRFMAYRGFEYDLIAKCKEVLVFGKDE